MKNYHRIFLASASPRRKELLSKAGIRFTVFETDVDETIPYDNPKELVENLSKKKANVAYKQLIELYPDETFVIIAADTVVSINNEVLGKPDSIEAAKSMLKKLSNNVHLVHTGVSVLQIQESEIIKSIHFSEKTKVHFLELEEDEIDSYITSKEPMDKAGAYAIQGKAAKFIKEIQGNYHNVVGLPISSLLNELKLNQMLVEQRKCKAVVFDLDGTVMNTLDSLAYCSNEVLKFFGKPPIEAEKYRYFVGNGAGKLVERFLEYSNLSVQEYYQQAKQLYMDIFSKHKAYKVMIYEGLYPVLLELKRRKIKIGVYTNKPDKEAKAILTTMFGSELFDEIRGDRNGKQLKPDPYALIEWSEKWGINTEDILYLGDTDTDMQTGRAADAYTVGVSWGFRERMELLKNGAYDVIDEPEWILNYI